MPEDQTPAPTEVASTENIDATENVGDSITENATVSAAENATDNAPEVQPVSEKTHQQSQPFIGQWNQLISTTNWDKGVIICQWRKSLEDQFADPGEYSDEAWAQLVGGVSSQHVGRLRRTSERFGHVFQEYSGLYWSHFYAALDWDDAEMWLEGAIQNKWSISQMRHQRWETMGKVAQDRPQDSDIVTLEMAEETQSLALAEKTEADRNNDRDYIEGPVHEGPDFGDEGEPSSASTTTAGEESTDTDGADAEPAKPHQIRPFESFKNLPEDVMDAANEFKVVIIKHKLGDWEEIDRDEMLGLLDALKQLATIAAE